MSAKVGKHLHEFRMYTFGEAPATRDDLKNLAVALMYDLQELKLSIQAMLPDGDKVTITEVVRNPPPGNIEPLVVDGEKEC